MTLLLLSVALTLAFANGANDNFKGVATLFGSGTIGYRRALAWATAATLLGSLASLWIGRGLIDAFQGKGLVPEAARADPRFLAAVALGAAVAVLLATRLGFPVSTTHALAGALVGAGWIAAQGEVRLAALGNVFLLPLLAGPLLALAVSALLYRFFRSARLALGVEEETCLCVGEEVRVIAAGPISPGAAAAAVEQARLSVSVGTTVRCMPRYRGRVVGIDAQTALDGLHYVSAGAVCFARGMNDTPKIAALLLAVPVLPPGAAVALLACAMALGGILQARRVADTMGHRIAEMNHGQGFTANLVSAILVLFASKAGLPASTTHVTCGGLFGIGIANRTARLGTISRIALAWVVTLPAAAGLAALAMFLLPRSAP